MFIDHQLYISYKQVDILVLDQNKKYEFLVNIVIVYILKPVLERHFSITVFNDFLLTCGFYK